MATKITSPSAKALQTKLAKQLDKNKDLLTANRELTKQNKKLIRDLDKKPIQLNLNKSDYAFLKKVLESYHPNELGKQVDLVSESKIAKKPIESDSSKSPVTVPVPESEPKKSVDTPSQEPVTISQSNSHANNVSVSEEPLDDRTFKEPEELDQLVEPEEEDTIDTSSDEQSLPIKKDNVQTQPDPKHDEDSDDFDFSGLFSESSQEKSAKDPHVEDQVKESSPVPVADKIEEPQEEDRTETTIDSSKQNSEDSFNDLVDLKGLELDDDTDDISSLFEESPKNSSAVASQSDAIDEPNSPDEVNTASLDPKKFDDGSDDDLLGLDDFI